MGEFPLIHYSLFTSETVSDWPTRTLGKKELAMMRIVSAKKWHSSITALILMTAVRPTGYIRVPVARRSRVCGVTPVLVRV